MEYYYEIIQLITSHKAVSDQILWDTVSKFVNTYMHHFFVDDDLNKIFANNSHGYYLVALTNNIINLFPQEAILCQMPFSELEKKINYYDQIIVERYDHPQKLLSFLMVLEIKKVRNLLVESEVSQNETFDHGNYFKMETEHRSGCKRELQYSTINDNHENSVEELYSEDTSICLPQQKRLKRTN
jgi:hypothetical protein